MPLNKLNKQVYKKLRLKPFYKHHPELYRKEELKVLKKILIDKYGEVCMKCGETEDICLNHILARAKGGTNDIDNLQLLCLKCNWRKAMSTVDYRPKESV